MSAKVDQLTNENLTVRSASDGFRRGAVTSDSEKQAIQRQLNASIQQNLHNVSEASARIGALEADLRNMTVL